MQSKLPLSPNNAPEITVVIPTYNEVDNINELVDRIRDVLQNRNWEIIFVDDNSPDQTAKLVRSLSIQDHRIRLLHRIGRSGLSSACIEGMLASRSPLIAVIDADLQHDETVLETMLVNFESHSYDLIVASRTVQSGSYGSMPSTRVRISELANRCANKLIKTPLSDPMSGFFMIKRDVIDRVVDHLYGHGFKILLDICVNSPQKLSILELPYEMKARTAGQSKLGITVIIDYFLFILNTLSGRLFPPRFLKFCLIGGSGVIVHLSILGLLNRIFEYPFLASQLVAVYIAMVSNYLLNNNFTFNEQRRSGARLWTGLINFILVCSIGAGLGIITGQLLHSYNTPWWLAGFATTVVAAVWNYSVSSTLTWRK